MGKTTRRLQKNLVTHKNLVIVTCLSQYFVKAIRETIPWDQIQINQSQIHVISSQNCFKMVLNDVEDCIDVGVSVTTEL